MPRNIIEEMSKGEISEDEALHIISENLSKKGFDPSCIGISNVEWTAYAQGADLHTITRWRKSGWPTKCSICRNNLPEPSEYGWFVWDIIEKKIGNYSGNIGLIHINCTQTKDN